MTTIFLFLLLQVGGIDNQSVSIGFTDNPPQIQQTCDIDTGWDEGD